MQKSLSRTHTRSLFLAIRHFIKYRPVRSLMITAAILTAMLVGAISKIHSFSLTAVKSMAANRYVATTGVNAGDCSNIASPCATVAYAISQSAMGDTINAAAGTYVLSSTINVNVANLTIQGNSNTTTIFQIAQSVGYAFNVSAAGVTLKDFRLQKTDVSGVHNLILVNGNNFTLQNSHVFGPDPGTPWSVNGIVSRALEVAGGLSGLLIQNNTFLHLRQPGYINSGTTGQILNNNVGGTRGWVVDGANITFSGNTWGPPVNQGADIALLASVNPANYPDLVALSLANSNAFISAQFNSPPAAPFNGRATAHVNAGAAPGGDGSSTLPYQTIAAGAGGALTGGTVSVAAGAYAELVNVNRSLTFTGTGMPMVMAPAGSNQTIFTIAAANVTIQGFKITVNRPNAAAGIAAINPAVFDGAQLLNNTIQSVGTGSTLTTPFGNTSAAGIALLGNGGAIESVTIKGNTINSGDATNFFSRGIWLREVKPTVGGATAAEGNTIVATTQDLLNQFSSGGLALIQNNTFNGAGLDNTEPNTGPLDILNNQFAPSSPLFSQSCLIKHNYLGVPVNVTSNIFTGHTTGLWSGGSSNVTISNNTFTPATGLAAYQHIRVDTAWPGTQVAPFNSNSVTISGNTLNGATGSSGIGILFKNGQKANTTDPDFSSVNLASNNFNSGLTEFMRLDGTAGQEFENNLDGTTGLYDVGAGLQLPSAMSVTQLAALENRVFHKLDNPTVGLVAFVAGNLFVSSTAASGTIPTASDNDYTRINNAVLAALSGTTIKLHGVFDWTETNAAASWEKGSDGVAGNVDDFSVYVPVNRNNITFTANTLGDATIKGPGDLPTFDLEGVLVFDGGDNQNWTISNIRFDDFDLAIAMFGGAGGVDAFNGTKIINNYIKIAKDLNATAAPGDSFQNIGIHFAYGVNQTISGNTIVFDGDGVSDSANNKFSTQVGMQSNTSGGNVYDGLQITNNILQVMNAQSADSQIIIGIWENSHGHLSNITVSGNSFTNLAAGNDPAINLQRAFRITSHSSASTTVKYEKNNIIGANIGFQWLAGQNFAGHQPVQLVGNNIVGNNKGILIDSSGSASLKFNRIAGNLVAGIENTTANAINAENNWWGCNFGPGVGGAGCSGPANSASNTGAGSIDSNPWLTLEIDALPVNIPAGGNSNLTASMKKNSDGVDTTAMAMGTVPNLTPVNFAASLGGVMPSNTTLTSAMANSVYTNSSSGIASVSSTVDQQTVSKNITIQCPVITVIPPANNTATAGSAFSETFTQMGGTLPVSYTTSSALPNGLRLSSGGVLSGTPLQTGVFPITVKATDVNNCLGTALYTLTINCQTISINPAILPGAFKDNSYNQALAQTGGIGSINWSISAGALPAGMTLSAGGLLSGTPTASGSSTFTARATDANGCFGERQYTLTVNSLAAGIADPLACTGPGNAVSVTATVTNNSAISQSSNFTANLPPSLKALPGTCASDVGACTVVNASTVNWSGTLATGQTVTINYQAQINDGLAVGTQVCVTSTATVGNSAPASVTACTTINCPAAGPGALPLTASPVSDQKAGSVLIYNAYSSSATGGNSQNTRITITNIHPQLKAFVHLFLVSDGCSVADSYLCLTPNQTTSFLTADLDPGTSGYIVAVATDSKGCPINFNHLIGDEYVKFASGHAANLAAVAITAVAGGLPLCDANSVTAQINFDGISYNVVPRTLALSNIGSKADGNDILLILNRIGGNLGIGASTLGSIFGILYDDAESALSFSVTGGCQLRSSLSNNFPRTAPRFEQFIPAGRTGWMRLFSQGEVGITGAVITSNPNAAAAAGAFNQGHNLHVLTNTSLAGYIIPVFPPSC